MYFEIKLIDWIDIIQQKNKTEAAYQTILTVVGNQHFNNIELETNIKMYESNLS